MDNFIRFASQVKLSYSLIEVLRVPIYAATDPNNVEKIKEGMFAELRRLREGEVLPNELERAKNSLIGQYLIARQTPAACAADLANNEWFGFGSDFTCRFLPPDGYTQAVVGP
jgi:predicted Zn-dependent peptidase